tara:strand:+ start:221 stop:745 length:525 start_codon:yes stop_codon:yes gene_type:complete
MVNNYKWKIHVSDLQERLHTKTIGRRLYTWDIFKGIIKYKFLSWTLVEYKKIVFLDLDIYINKNIDSLFAIELRKPIAAVNACSNSTFNSGVLLFSPSIFEASELLNRRVYGNAICEIRKSDQTIINYKYKNNWQKLPDYYNYHGHYWIFKNRKLLTQKVLHVVGEPKKLFCKT